MKRIGLFVAAVALSLSAFAQGQRARPIEIPPGPTYDAAKHVNPMITFVQAKDFKSATYKEAQDIVDFPLLGISKETGSLDSISVAQPPVDASKELRLNVKATFYPVVRQIFKIAGGGEVVLYSFKTPRVQDNSFPRLGVGGMSNRGLDNSKKRLGSVNLPEELEVRGLHGLLFEQDKTLTVAWQEEGVIYTATSSLSRQALFDVIDDLL
jgi:hypothetical protein